jgi:hypothetical protein
MGEGKSMMKEYDVRKQINMMLNLHYNEGKYMGSTNTFFNSTILK